MQFLDFKSSFIEPFFSDYPETMAIAILMIISMLIYLITLPDLSRKMKFLKVNTLLLYAIFFLYSSKILSFLILIIMDYKFEYIIEYGKIQVLRMFNVLDLFFFIVFVLLNIDFRKTNYYFESKPKRVFKYIITGCVIFFVPIGTLWGIENAKAYPEWDFYYHIFLEALYILYFLIGLPEAIIGLFRVYKEKNKVKSSLELQDLSKHYSSMINVYDEVDFLALKEISTIDSR